MLEANSNAIWVIQSWGENSTSGLLVGLDDVENGKEHALILDLWAEGVPNYKNGCPGNEAYGYAEEFDHTPWLFCMVNNFGGHLGLHGYLDNLVSRIPEAFNSCKKITGISVMPEASENNPVLYDCFYECIWQDDASRKLPEINIENWLDEYSIRKYGKASRAAQSAWDILKETVYKAKFNDLGQGAPECVFTARPPVTIRAASAWGNAIVSYDKKELEKAAKLLLEDYDSLKESAGYIYDVVSILQQVLSNRAQDYCNQMVVDYQKGDLQRFEKDAEKFLSVADRIEQVTSRSPYYLLGRWLGQAKRLAEHLDDFSKHLYEYNARTLITTGGAYTLAENGMLHDYSNR